MRILFIHQNFPAQFRHVAPALARAGHEVHSLSVQRRAPIPGVQGHTYAITRNSTKGIHPWVIDFETKTIRAESCARKMVELKSQGLTPDLVIGHPGWGETWLVKDIWPNAPLLLFQEFFYGADTDFDPEFAASNPESHWRTRIKNVNILTGLESMDWGITPTEWQRAQFPARWQERMSVVFDGTDTDWICPSSTAVFTTREPALNLKLGDEVVTFVNRNLEPYRGYHVFMRSLPKLFELRPNAVVVIVGNDGQGYGAIPKSGTWREHFYNEVRGRIDTRRVHFLGQVPHESLLQLYRVAACHVYLTYPFVLSWSMLECMSAGGIVVGSKTPPVEEVISDGVNGLLVDFFDPEAIACRVSDVLSDPARHLAIREAARRTVVERYDLRTQCLPKHLALIEAVANRRVEPGM